MSSFSIRCYHVETELGSFSTYPGSYSLQISAEVQADILWLRDQEDVDGPKFDSVAVVNELGEEVYTKE